MYCLMSCSAVVTCFVVTFYANFIKTEPINFYNVFNCPKGQGQQAMQTIALRNLKMLSRHIAKKEIR